MNHFLEQDVASKCLFLKSILVWSWCYICCYTIWNDWL